jgi:hypothetical protein
VAGRVDQIQHVRLAVLRFVVEPDCVRFDRDAALALEIHVVEHLRFHLAAGHRAGQFEQAIGQRRLAVIDVRDDREIANARWIHALDVLFTLLLVLKLELAFALELRFVLTL